MKEIILKSFGFVKKNPGIIYSLALIFLIPLAIAFNTYYAVNRFQRNMDMVIQSKAVLAENILNLVVRDHVTDSEKLKELVAQIKLQNKEIEYFEIYVPEEDGRTFRAAVGSPTPNDLPNRNVQNILAWNDSRGIAFLENNESGRFWNVTKAIVAQSGEKTGLMSISFSLSSLDEMTERTILASYSILFFTIIIVLLLVANNVRLLGYALTVSKLREIDKMKDVFISMASHELRAPLVSMKGNVEFLQEEINPYLNDDGKNYVSNISVSIERMEMLVNDILEVSRIEGNRLPMSITTVEISEVIEKSIEEIKIQAARKGLLFIYHSQSLPKVKADPERVKQILINLLSNAVKYTPQGQIEIITEIKEKFLAIVVADTGVGISASDQAKLFQKFSRVYNEKTKTVGGTGLGLWISRELARKMGGEITVESIPGVGTHFTLNLPLA